MSEVESRARDAEKRVSFVLLQIFVRVHVRVYRQRFGRCPTCLLSCVSRRRASKLSKLKHERSLCSKTTFSSNKPRSRVLTTNSLTSRLAGAPTHPSPQSYSEPTRIFLTRLVVLQDRRKSHVRRDSRSTRSISRSRKRVTTSQQRTRAPATRS